MNPLIYRIALSLLLARWKQALVAAIGVTFGIATFIALLTFMMGLNELLDNMILNRSPHVRLFNEIRPNPDQAIMLKDPSPETHHFIHSLRAANERQDIHDGRVIEELLRSDPRVSGVAARAGTQVFFNDGIIDITGMLNGIDVRQEMVLFHFNDYVTEGNPMDLQTVPNSIVLGASLASSLRVTLGDRVFVTTPQGQHFPLKVSGIFQSGLQEYDKVQSFASLETVQKVMTKSHNYITDLQIRLHDISKAPELGREFATRFQTDSEDIQTSNAQFETGSSIRTTISYAVGITLLIVAGFGIFNILNMMIYEKMDSIAILKATGFSGGDVDRIFTVMALGIGLFGGVFGLAIGFSLSYIIDHIPFVTKSLPTITTYPVSYNPLFYIIGFTFSLLTTYLAGWAPARKASRIDPVIIIRGK